MRYQSALPNTIQKQARDKDIFPLAVSLLFEDYHYLVPTSKAREKRRILAGEDLEPTFVYKRLQNARCEAWSEQLERLKEKVEVHADPIVQEAYRPKVAEIKDKIGLLKAAIRGDDRAFGSASCALYGKPKIAIAQYTLHQLRKKCAILREHTQNPDMRSTITSVENLCVHIRIETAKNGAFTKNTLPQPIIDKTPLVSAQTLKDMCEQALERHDITDWKVQIAGMNGPTTFDTNHNRKIVFVPRDEHIETRKHPLTQKRAEALIAHEIGTHVVRRANGEKSSLLLLGRGLAHYLPGEEGLATYMEQHILGAEDFTGESQYLSLILAYGSLDNTPRTFRQVFNTLIPCVFVTLAHQAATHKVPFDTDALYRSARERAWALCIRIFRGTSGKTPGAVFGKDVVYRDGNIALWQLLSKDPSKKAHLFAGKYDPSNKSHWSLLKKMKLVRD